ncbi:MAG: IS200/IS605 family transposase [Saprospiraceae bacterium]
MTYSTIYIHIVFGIKRNFSVPIDPDWEVDLHKYISKIISNKGQKLIVINGMPDHIHILININPDLSISALVREIKKHSNKWVNEKFVTKGIFKWQEGFGAFSHCKSSIKNAIKYIENQKQHHGKVSFEQEYNSFLKVHEVCSKEPIKIKP